VPVLNRPDDPVKFWNEYFSEKKVPLAEFIPPFEEEFNGGAVLNHEERDILDGMIDKTPRDGYVSVLEW
jgi:hypothetical protein